MPSSQIERQLAAIMFTEISGYASLSRIDEGKALELLEKQNQVLIPIIEEFGGILHKKLGDGFLITFSTITNAIKCASEFQKKTQPIENLDLCIAIHEGEITFKDDDVFGNNVNISSLMLRYSTVGGVVISEKVYHNISNLPEFETAFITEENFKASTEKIKIYAITSHGFLFNSNDTIEKPLKNTSFIKTLLERRILHILGSYLVAGTSLILFIQYLVDKYQFPSYYPTLALFALIGILPSVMILGYFHGAPGKDEWTKVEKVGIPINILFIAVVLFFGDSMNIWQIKDISEDTTPTISLIHFTSLSEQVPHFKKHLILEDDIDLYPIDTLLLDSLRNYFSVQLLNWYFGKNNNFIIPKHEKDINYLNSHPLLSVDLDFTEERRDDAEFWKSSADSIYAKFNSPNHIAYFNIYKISSDMVEYKYLNTSSYLRENPNKGINGDGNYSVKSISDLFDRIQSDIESLLGASKNIGFISEINDDIILVNLKDMNVRKNMELRGTTTYNHQPGHDGYKNRLEDLKNAIEHMSRINNGKYDSDLASDQDTYLSLLEDSLYCMQFKNGKHVGGCVQTRGQDYFLRVINVIDSVAVTKLINFKYPWVKVRINDYVYVTTN